MDLAVFNFISVGEVVTVLVRTLIIFFFAFLALRMLGKKQLAHLTFVDLLLVIALGSAVGDVMIYDETVTQMFTSMIAITVVAAFVKILNELSAHSKKVSSFMTGDARLVIENGKFIQTALAREDMNEEDIMRILRPKGYQTTKHIKKAFLEADGELSVITYNKKEQPEDSGKDIND